MESILSKANQRRLHLLYVLGTTQKWLHFEELAGLVGASKKTIADDLRFFEAQWPHVLQIDVNQKHGVRMTESSHSSIQDIYLEMISESTAFSLLEGIFYQPGKSSEYWEQQFFLSHSSLYRLTRKINTFLNKRNLSLNIATFTIEGENEREIRYFFANYFFEIHGIHGWPFPLQRDKLVRLAANISHAFDLDFKEHQVMELVFVIVVSTYREVQGYSMRNYLERNPLPQELAEKIAVYKEDLQEIIAPLNLKLSDQWVAISGSSIFWWFFGWNNVQEKLRVRDLAEEFVQIVTRSLKVSITAENRKSLLNLFEFTYAKHRFFPYKKFFDYDRNWFSSKALQQQFILFSRVTKKALQEMERKHKFPWFSIYYEELLSRIIFQWDGLPEMLIANRPKIKVGVYSDQGSIHANLIAHFIQKNLQGRIELVIPNKPFYEIDWENLPSFELYISNFKLQMIAQDKFLYVENIPSFKNQLNLIKKIDEIRLEKAPKIPFLES